MVWKANVTLDNVSPLINYSPATAWHEGDSRDPSWQSYDHNTFTLTTQFGANASVTFNGTAVWVIGAKRGNHAPYSTTLDGKLTSDTGYSSTDKFQQALFTRTELDGGNHTVSITNLVDDAGKPYLDIDSIVYEVEIPDDYVRNTLEDTDDAHFNFSSSAWSTNPEGVANYSDATGHTTSSPDAFVVFTFEGDGRSAVEIYGAVGPRSGDYTVQVDGGDSFTFNGTKSALVPQTLLYQDNDLGSGTHAVKISNSPFTGQTLSIDYAIAYGPSSTNLGSGSGGGSSSSLSKGAIGGIAVGGCAGVLLVLVGVFLWHRRRAGRSGLTHVEDPSGLADYGTGPVTFHTPSLPLTAEWYPPLPVPATVVHPPSTSPPQSNSSASNSDSRHRLIMHNPNPSLTGPADIAGALLDIAPVSSDTRPHQNPAQTLRPLPQPGSSDTRLLANASVLPLLPGTDLRNMRMQVEGRSQDFGPIVFIPEPEHEGNLLPPDYYQATEPFPPLPR